MNIHVSIAILYLLLISNFENAYLFGACFLITMIVSDFIITSIKRFIYPNIRIPASLIITGTIITIIEIYIKRYIPGFYSDMGIYLPIMMLIIYDYDSNRSISESFMYTLTKGVKYVVLLLFLVFFKELFGSSMITVASNISNITGHNVIYQIVSDSNLIPLSFLTGSGGFILVGIALGFISKLRGEEND